VNRAVELQIKNTKTIGYFMIIAGNWKMNPDHQAAEALLQALSDYTPASDRRCEIVCFPPACYFSIAHKALADTAVSWGAQNCHQAGSGAFTGEISAQMIKEQGGAWVILGHSERRQYFAEADATVSQKIVTALQTGLRPILCVGEPEEIRNKNNQDNFVQSQLEASLELVAQMSPDAQKDALAQLVIAYEPVWAIGTGKVASLQDIEAMHQGLSQKMEALFGVQLPEAGAPILYGGSVNDANASDILSLKPVSGALVGGASLKPDSFLSICQLAGKK
jgi:triosephosphate isomerase